MKVAILGTTGYTGLVLLRLLARHSQVTEILPVSSSQEGSDLFDIDPGLGDGIRSKSTLSGGKLMALDAVVAKEPDAVFAALPHLKSAEVCAPFFGRCPVIDLSADFRIKDVGAFTAAYGSAPPRPDLLEQAVYGLSEWNREQIRRADLVANPGCYPTATLLPLLPLATAGLIEPEVDVVAISGISGAGRSAKTNSLFCERTENMNPYSPGKTHRHTAEIQAEVDARAAGFDIIFTPHLVPIRQGMIVTQTVRLKSGISDGQVDDAILARYADEPFVRCRKDTLPETRWVRNSNRCDIAWRREGRRLILMSAIDNLIKGAAGQAVQNLNIRFGYDEEDGIADAGEF